MLSDPCRPAVRRRLGHATDFVGGNELEGRREALPLVSCVTDELQQGGVAAGNDDGWKSGEGVAAAVCCQDTGVT